MRIEHLAIWVSDLELMRRFYETYFGATSGGKYHNTKKNFTSYFLSFDTGSRLELMQKPEIASVENRTIEYLGISHFNSYRLQRKGRYTYRTVENGWIYNSWKP